MEICGLHSNSLHPPTLSDTDDDAATLENLPYILLELEAYVTERDNAATTAFSTTCDGKRVQVTLFPRRPPRVSYVCVHSSDGAKINMEPTVLAAEGDILLLCLIVRAKGSKVSNIDYYVYRVGGGGGGGAEGPSLTLLPRPRPTTTSTLAPLVSCSIAPTVSATKRTCSPDRIMHNGGSRRESSTSASTTPSREL
jgi:hypothetical protein